MKNLLIKNISSRLTVKFILFFILGILSYNIYGFKTLIQSSLFIGIFFLCIFIFSVKYKSVFYGIMLFVYLISYISGGVYFKNFDSTNQIELRSKVDEKLWVYGIVTSSPKLSDSKKYYSVNIEIHEIETLDNKLPISGNMKIFVKIWQNKFPDINQFVFFNTELQTPSNQDNSFDYVKYLKTQDIYITGFTNNLYVDENPDYKLSPTDRLKFNGRALNNSFSKRIDELFSYDKDANAVIKGIMLGDKSDFSEELSTSFSETGISHITAVSGLHLSIIFEALFVLLILLKIRKKYIIFISPLILIFCSIIGFTPSIIRASVMIFISLLALIFKRQYDSITALFISAFVILVHNPYLIYSISFILSFASTLFIIKLYPIISCGIKKIVGERLNFLASSIAVSLAAFIGTAPFVTYYFKYISFASIIANIWVVPLCSFVLVLGYVYLFLSYIVPVSAMSFILYPLVTCVDLIIRTTHISSTIPYLSINVESITTWHIAGYFLIIYILYILLRIIKTLRQKHS